MRKKNMMKYVLRILLFILQLALVGTVIWLPFCFVGIVTRWRSAGVFIFACIYVGTAYYLGTSLFEEPLRDSFDDYMSCSFRRALFFAFPVGAVLFILFLTPVFAVYPIGLQVLLSGAAAALAGLCLLPGIIRRAKEAHFKEAPGTYSYPEDRDALVKAARNHPNDMARKAALKKLPYPDERDTLIYALENDRQPNNCRLALDKLPWPEERECLIRTVRSHRDYSVRSAALSRLPAEEEQETIAAVALEDSAVNIRLSALKKLTDSTGEAPLNAPAGQTLAALALQDQNPGIRKEALSRLPYPEYSEVYEKADKQIIETGSAKKTKPKKVF